MSHSEVLVQDLAGLLHLELLHAEEAEDEGRVEADPPDVGLGLEPLTDLRQGALTHLRLLLQKVKQITEN